ncbi:MAG: beta-N-acetylhexosaminidase, partial [Gemmatimonadales bacterium]
MGARPPDLPIGRLLMADLPGTSATPQLRDLIASHALGGVTLFAKNVETAAQVAELCRGLQSGAAEAGLPPLLIAIDQE